MRKAAHATMGPNPLTIRARIALMAALGLALIALGPMADAQTTSSIPAAESAKPKGAKGKEAETKSKDAKSKDAKSQDAKSKDAKSKDPKSKNAKAGKSESKAASKPSEPAVPY